MRKLTRALALAAYYRLPRLDGPGTACDADEVEALTAYMERRYVCPSLTKRDRPRN